jgi:exodeoxyribonuclease V gamma subunit
MVSLMTGLQITTSNMMEILAARLADVMAVPLASPLSEEIVVINSRGMERWLAMRLAEHHGICANVSFRFPRPCLADLMGKAIGRPPEPDTYNPDYLTWKLMRILPELSRQEDFRDIRLYLSDGANRPAVRLYQLACRIARVFDQYLVYRPEMIRRWEAGQNGNGNELWQAALWRAVIADNAPGPHPAALFSRFRERLMSCAAESSNLPERISLIGISALPPLFIDILNLIATRTEVHLFLVNPCREYWSGITSDRETESVLRRFATRTDAQVSEEDLFLERGNPLLASMGKIGRDFFNVFAEVSAQHQDFYVLPGESTLLRTVQSDILNLVDRGKGETAPATMPDRDASIAIHSCHGPMREVEVLRDQLLSLFDQDRTLRPRDILVMTPDIETYAPLIEAVFGRTGDESRNGIDSHIPFSIADRRHMKNNPLADAFFKILDLPSSRFEASRILALLDNRAVRETFGIGEDRIPMIRRWVGETGIRWGIDDGTFSEMGLPATTEHTWKRGIDKMLLGYALPGENRRLFMDMLPYDAIEGEQAEFLGLFLDFLDRLFETAAVLREPHSLDAWHEILDGMIERFFDIRDDDEWISYRQHLLDTIHDLSKLKEISGLDEGVPLDVIREHLENRLESAGFSSGFLTGGVTFCAMVPMRTIPFRIICLLGMNYRSFPRESMKIGFDLIEKHPRRGDRSKRDDDRYLFLETILSAREKLMIFYTGQNLRDNTRIPPAVVVSELLDYIEQAFVPGHPPSDSPESPVRDRSGIRNRLITEHPLQPFSPAYFTGRNRLFSYSEEYCRAARSLAAGSTAARPFLSSPLPVERKIPREVAVSDLIRFFRQPARFFVTSVLGIDLRGEEEKIEDSEIFTLSGLARYEVEQSLLASKMSAAGPGDEYRVLLGAGKLPQGSVGQVQYEALGLGIGRFVSRVALRVPDENRYPVPVDLAIGDDRLTGRLDLWSPSGIFLYRYAELKGKDYLQAWLQHLILNALAPDRDWRNQIAGRKEWWLLARPDHAGGLLSRLLDLFHDGLTRPLHFFPQASLQYARALRSGKSRYEALASARSAWQTTEFSRGEAGDPCLRLCFGKTDPLDEAFCSLSETVYTPLLTHQISLPDSDEEP